MFAKRVLRRVTGFDTYKTLRIVNPSTDFAWIDPHFKKDLWAKNYPYFKFLLSLAQKYEVTTDLQTFTRYLKEGLSEIDRGIRIKSDWHHLRLAIALAIHYYLLGYTEVIVYETAPEVWSIGRRDGKHNYLVDANTMINMISQMLGIEAAKLIVHEK